MAVETVYQYPHDYELEVASQHLQDASFWADLVRGERPKRVLEIGCGTGRLTIPLGREGADHGFTAIGLDSEAAMVECAREHLRHEPVEVQRAVRFVHGDARNLMAAGPAAERFDVILMPYGVAHHFITTEEQTAAWRAARGRLAQGGLLGVDITMPDPTSLADTQKGSHRTVDLDVWGADGRHLRRTVAQQYDAESQRMTMDFHYEVTEPDGTRRAYPSTFVMYVYRAQELTRLFERTGFTVERLVGSYSGDPYDTCSRQLIALARPTVS